MSTALPDQEAEMTHLARLNAQARREATDGALRLRWLGEAVAWHVPTAANTVKLRSLVQVLASPALPTPQLALPRGTGSQWHAEMVLAALTVTGLAEAASWLHPSQVLGLALLGRHSAAWVRQLLRSLAMDAFFSRLACGCVRPSAVLHPELLAGGSRAILASWLGSEVQARACTNDTYFQRNEHLHIQHLAELWAHFCNIGDMGQCQSLPWRRLSFDPFLTRCSRSTWGWRPSPSSSKMDLLAEIKESISDYMVCPNVNPNAELRAAAGATMRWLHSPLFLGQPSVNANRTLQSLLRKYASLFPQKSDWQLAATCREEMEPEDCDDHQQAEYEAAVAHAKQRYGERYGGAPVPCRWARAPCRRTSRIAQTRGAGTRARAC